MGSLGGDGDGSKPCKGKSNIDIEDTQHLEFDSQYSPFSGEENDDLLCGLRYLEPFDDALLANDAFDTQLLHFDTETQPLNLVEETQVMDFGEETQVLDNVEDYYSDLETQLLCDTDEEQTVWGSDKEDTVGTEVLTDTESFKRSSANALGSEGMQHTSICNQEEAESKSVGSVHSAGAACSSGSVRRGFTSIRTASLRASGLSARRKSLKGVESEDASNQSGVKSSFQSCDGTVDQSDMGKTSERLKGLNYDSNTKHGRSTARKLLLDDINIAEGDINIAEDENKDIANDGARGEDLGQVHSYTNESAGLSYVNSQEPGDLSQANALDFVDQFLKDNVCDFDLGARRLHAACENQNPILSAMGTQKLAKRINISCSHAKRGVYDWNNSLEDEGGGEFLTRNKELFFGKKNFAHKPITEPPNSKHLSRMKKGRNQKSINEEGQPIDKHIGLKGFAHSEPTCAAGRKLDQLEKLNIRRDLNCDFNEQVETGAIDAEMVEAVGVGVDTEMAAEAMETLSKGIALSMDGENAFEGEDCRGQLKDKMTKRSNVKQNLYRKRVLAFDLGVTTRSKRNKRSRNHMGDVSKHSAASDPQNARKQVVKGKATSRMQNTVKMTKINVGIPEKNSLKVNDKVKNGAQERNLDDNGSTPAKKQCIEKKINSVAPIASRTRKVRQATVSTANATSESSDDPKSGTENLTAVDNDGSKRKRNNAGVDAKTKSLQLDQLNCSSGNVQNRSDQSKNDKSKGSLEEYAKHDLGGQAITRKRRSSRYVLPQKQSKPTLCSNDDICSSPSAENRPERLTQGTPKEMAKPFPSACTTPANLRTPINTSSPVCMGDEYYKISCKKNQTSSLVKELNSLTPSEPICSSPDKGLRKRRDITSIRVLFSHHLDEEIIKHQKKILARLGVTAVSSVLDATHFVTDEFVRTRNMLDAIAHGKPVVNHLWLESCGQAGCYIDEKKYLLRDAKKEKELGFNMPDSLARARQHPLLEGRKVLITPNTMPGVEILSNLVKAVHGQAFERICRSIYKGDELGNNLLVLSCEEDYEFCVPLLKKGAKVYSSELLLNGIVTQKLEFERHSLFMDKVKRTRSTIWMKKGGGEFQPVARHV